MHAHKHTVPLPPQCLHTPSRRSCLLQIGRCANASEQPGRRSPTALRQFHSHPTLLTSALEPFPRSLLSFSVCSSTYWTGLVWYDLVSRKAIFDGFGPMGVSLFVTCVFSPLHPGTFFILDSRSSTSSQAKSPKSSGITTPNCHRHHTRCVLFLRPPRRCRPFHRKKTAPRRHHGVLPSTHPRWVYWRRWVVPDRDWVSVCAKMYRPGHANNGGGRLRTLARVVGRYC